MFHTHKIALLHVSTTTRSHLQGPAQFKDTHKYIYIYIYIYIYKDKVHTIQAAKGLEGKERYSPTHSRPRR
jgi:hypothetical protein